MKKWKRNLNRLLFLRRLCSPWFLGVYCLAWFCLCRLCRYGGVRRNLPVLMACGLFFLGCLFVYLIERSLYKRNSTQEIFGELWLKDNQVKLPDGTEFDYEEIRWYRKKRDDIQIFLKGHRFIWLHTEMFLQKNKEYLEVKLTQRGISATQFWKVPVACLLAGTTLAGAFYAGWSAVPYNGKLSWVVQDLKNRRKAALVHNNIYRDGLDGILKDIETRVEFPEKLCLVNSLNLHFAADGTVESLDTFIQGFDSQGNFVDTYLISYNASRSDKIDIYLHGYGGEPVFDEEKDLEPLLKAMQVIPLEDTVADWRQDTYGILYYGVRNWGYNTEGIRYINPSGTITVPGEFPDNEIMGPSISVFCPEDESITPIRYLYQGVL